MSSSDNVKISPTKDSPINLSSRHIEAEQNLKLVSAVPITILFMLVLISGWMFEDSLGTTHSNVVAIKLAPSNTEEHEAEESETDNLIKEEVRIASELLFEALLSQDVGAIDVNETDILMTLEESDRRRTLVLVAKKLSKNKYYQRALEVIIDLAQEQQESLGLIFTKAYVLIKLGNTEAGIISYKHLLTLQPQNQTAIINLGLAYLALQDYPHAEKVFARGILLSNGNRKSKCYAGLARVMFMTKRYPESISNYKKAIEYRPTHANNWRNLGSVAEKMENYILAKDSYEKAVALEPDDLISRMKYANYLISRLDYIGAIEHLMKAKSIDRESFRIRLKLAFAYLHARKPINARKQLLLAKKNVQQPHQKAIGDAIQFFLRDKYLEAIKLLKANLKNRTNIELENYLIAMCYVEVNRLKDSRKYVSQLTKTSIYYSAGQYLLAEAYIDNKKTKESLVVFDSLLARINNNSKLFLQAAKAYQLAGNFPEAINLVNKALKLGSSKQLLLRRANLEWLSDSRESAIFELKELLDEYPSYLRARYHLADYNNKMGNNVVAVEGFAQLLSIRSNYGDAQYQLGRLYFEMGQFDASLPYLSEYLLQRPDSKRTRTLYARAFCETGQSLECKEQLELVIKLSPTYAPAVELLQKLKVDE